MLSLWVSLLTGGLNVYKLTGIQIITIISFLAWNIRHLNPKHQVEIVCEMLPVLQYIYIYIYLYYIVYNYIIYDYIYSCGFAFQTTYGKASGFVLQATAIGMKLNAKSLDVVGSIGTAGEIWEIELDPRDGGQVWVRNPMADGRMGQLWNFIEWETKNTQYKWDWMGIYWEYDGSMMGVWW